MASQRPSRHGCGVRSPRPAARSNRRAAGVTRAVERPTRSQPTLGSSLSAIWSSRPPSWAIGETRNDGRSKRAGWPPSNTSTTRSTAPSRTRQEHSRTTNAVTRPRPHASSRTSGGSAHCSAPAHGSTPISRCAAPTSASTSATLPAPSNTPRLRTTHYRDIPMPERSRPGCNVSKRGSGEDRTTDSHLPSSGSSPSFGRTSRSRTSPIVFTSHALPSRHTSRRSTTSSASQADPTLSRSSSRPASNRQKPRSRCRVQNSTGVAMPNRRWLTGQAVRWGSSEGEAPAMRRPPADTPDVAA